MDSLRLYLDPAEIHEQTGYPFRWSQPDGDEPAVKDLVRELMGHRCERCGHPYRKGEHGNGQWSPCDENCTHGGPVRARTGVDDSWETYERGAEWGIGPSRDPDDPLFAIEAEWRILTVHHLGEKYDCRWFMLVALCQRCHLQVQAKVQMNRVWPWEHSQWFKVYAAAWYAWVYEDREITREEATARMDELLAYERLA